MSPQTTAIRASIIAAWQPICMTLGMELMSRPALLYLDDLEGEQKDKGNFDDLVGLDIQGEAGDDLVQGQPVPVAGVVVGAQGGEQQQNKHDVEGQKQLPMAFRKKLKVHKGQQNVGDDAEADGQCTGPG